MKTRITDLRSIINHHNHLYYVLGKPEISDAQYDVLFQKLLDLETEYPELHDPNSPTSRVGSDLPARFNAEPHPEPMLSLRSFFSTEALSKANLPLSNSTPAPGQYAIQPKFDGMAIELTYQNGQLVKALSRGNGFLGENITANARTIRNIPLTLPQPENITIRGEALISAHEMNRLNKIRAQQNIPLFSNPRNAVAGLLKTRQSSITARAKINMLAFEITGTGEHYQQTIQTLQNLGFKTPETFYADTFSHAVKVAEAVAVANHSFQHDGAVIKVTAPQTRAALGGTRKDYNWGVALKPNAPVFETPLRFIAFPVAKTGTLTPVAHFEPFTCGGTTFHKATIKKSVVVSNLNDGLCHVQIIGGIIPEVILLPSPVIPPSVCPACHSPLVNNRCENTTWCPARGFTADTVRQYTRLPYQVEVAVAEPDGINILQTACLGKNALVVRETKNRHNYILLADNIDTIADIAVAEGELEPGLKPFERQHVSEIIRNVRASEKKSFIDNFKP